ncbi:MAG: hypothetical protein Tp132SUR1191571_23 [Prokaryotic dsDNA virus sp.]|jgi:hypothetical protein|nr:MAG: hypothetical protein Tp132SUR1191571_23 [Prokaryotic dsDNA virus sp.]|tara:strand:- start:3441 stop:3896 length:456 start_codon:yes stop_codon:yes gene_type:complete
MARTKAKTTHPVVKYGGVRMLQKRIKRSQIIDHSKDAVAQELVDLSTSNITDIIDWENGKIRLKEISEIPEKALRSIKKIRVYGKENNNFEVEMHDKIRSLQTVAKAAGLLEQEKSDDDKPAVIGIKIEGPDKVEIKELKKVGDDKSNLDE